MNSIKRPTLGSRRLDALKGRAIRVVILKLCRKKGGVANQFYSADFFNRIFIRIFIGSFIGSFIRRLNEKKIECRFRPLGNHQTKYYNMAWYMLKHSRRSGRFRRMSRKAIEATNDHNLILRQFSDIDRFLMCRFYDWSDDKE
jgi:hypothetical protein